MLHIESLQENLEKTLSAQLDSLLPKHPISEVYRYASLPPGKLFRPLISAGVYLTHSNDNINIYNDKNSNPSKLAGFLELHHSYTLVHDDMPCMDNDDIRRGRPATHKAFGLWKALLIGDGLQTASWHLLSTIKSHQLAALFHYSSWALGPKGLLQGQVLDLSLEMTSSFENLMLTHKFKTARLIQTALVGGYLITDKPSLAQAKKYHQLGEAIGLSFQLLDDLTELDSKLSKHERDVNPWLWAATDSKLALETNLAKIEELTPKEALLLKEILSRYFKIIYKKIEMGRSSILKNLDIYQLGPIEALLKVLSRI